MDDKVVLKSYENKYEANIDHRRLAENKIESWIIDKKDSAYVMIGDIELYVDAENFEKAKEIID